MREFRLNSGHPLGTAELTKLRCHFFKSKKTSWRTLALDHLEDWQWHHFSNQMLNIMKFANCHIIVELVKEAGFTIDYNATHFTSTFQTNCWYSRAHYILWGAIPEIELRSIGKGYQMLLWTGRSGQDSTAVPRHRPGGIPSPGWLCTELQKPPG